MLLAPIVSADWLTEHRDDVVLCDVRAYLDGRSGADAYAAGHIAGARFIDLDAVLAAAPAKVLGRHPLPSPEVFAAGMGAAGIGHHTTVVAYDDAGGMIAGRLVWMLRIFGQHAALLDGGIDAWSGGLSIETPIVRPVDHAVRTWPPSATADPDELQAIIEAGGAVIDSRGAPRFRGEFEPIDTRAGHVPGAINLPFAENLDSGHFRSIPELRERFEAIGVDEHTVFYCGSGVSACNNLLAAEAAGFPLARLYVGSWSGWSSDPRRPVATD